MENWRFWTVDFVTGEPFEVAPQDVSRPKVSRALKGNGGGSLTVPLDAGYDFTIPVREVTAARLDSSGEPQMWVNGPVSDLITDRYNGTLTVNFREASAYMDERVHDGDATWTSEDIATVAKDIVDYGVNQQTTISATDYPQYTGTGLPNWTTSRTNTGTLKTDLNGSAAWHKADTSWWPIRQILDDLSNIDPGGFEWRMEYANGAGAGRCDREFVIHPQFGGTPVMYVRGGLAGLVSFTQTQTRNGSANLLYGFGRDGETLALRNDASFLAGDQLIAAPFAQPSDNPDLTLEDWLQQQRKVFAPPINVIEVSYTPTEDGLPFDGVIPGEVVALHVNNGTVFDDPAYDERRIGEVTVEQNEDGAEIVTLAFVEPD